MKLSAKEKMLIALLGGVFVTVSYYNFIYINQKEKIEILKEEKFKVETKYNEVMETIKVLDERKEKVTSLLSTVNFKSKEFYPTIIQEKIILDLDTFLKQSTLKGDIGFSEIVIQSVEVVTSDENKKEQSTFQGIVDEYKGTKTEKENNLNESQDVNQETPEDTTQEKNQESVPTTQNQTSSTTETLKVTINFKGVYDTVKSFISKIETSNRQIAISDLSTSVGYNGELTGTMNLEFYAIPKISERDGEYLEWTLNGTYGKRVPFLIQKPEVVVEKPEENSESNDNQNTNQQLKSDFAVIVKSIKSDLPTVIIGKANDSKQETYINAKNNNVENSEIHFKKIDGKYYYKYKNSSKYYPADYSGKGMEFLPNSDSIIIEVNSEKRVDTDDKSALQLSVVNETDKIVEVYIKGDDKTNPRVTITGDSSKVKVNRK